MAKCRLSIKFNLTSTTIEVSTPLSLLRNSIVGNQILIVDDDILLRRSVAFSLNKGGYSTVTAGSAEEALTIIQNRAPDLILLDIGLPGGMDGLQALRLFQMEKSIPIIFLTARRRELDEVVGLELGADDYITKPFSPKELVARAQAVLRRTKSASAIQEYIKIDDLTIDLDKHEVIIKNEPVQLTLTEFKILYHLARKPGRVFTRDQLLDAVSGPETAVTDRTIDVHVASLRKKLKTFANRIATIRGIGYKFKE